MSIRIEQDHNRFKEIVKGKIKKNLRKYISNSDMIGKKGDRFVNIPVPQIDLPRFKYGKNKGGVGQGNGKEGDAVGQGEGDGDGQGAAGNSPGKHLTEVEISIEELADMLANELELPNIEPKGSREIKSKIDKYTGVRRTGPESLRHTKRTFKQALRRQISLGTFNKEKPVIIPIRDDMRYKSWKTTVEKQNNCVIIYMMDVSGSMWDEQKEIVRTEAFWINTWLKKNYKGIESRYIIHDAMAREVSEEQFFTTKESGGTIISSAYYLADKIIKTDYPPHEWNIYLFHFSDGDNWSKEDNETSINLINNEFVGTANLFGYGQVESPHGSGQFYNELSKSFGSEDSVILSKIPDREAIVSSIKDFFGSGQ